MAVILVALTILFGSCKKSTEEATPVLKNSIAYIYKADNTDGAAFKALLEENECHVTLIDRSVASTINYASYKMIVIDNNADATLTGSSFTDAESTALNNTGKPMLLMGIGGLQFAKKIGNVANFTNTAIWNEKGFFVYDKSSSLYKTPFAIPIPTSTPAINIYPSNVPGCGQLVHLGTTLPDNVLLGRFNLASEYYPVTYEKSRYMTFGFQKGVSEMNELGRQYMVNLCYFVGGLTL